MEFLYSKEGKEGIEKMAGEIATQLNAGQKVLWLICGGSNIPLSAQAEKLIRLRVKEHELKNLTIGQTDERFGPVGHPDSNWQQMHKAHFNFEGVRILPILSNKSLEETVSDYETTLANAFSNNDIVVAQFGIGADGHVAGMLPHTGGLSASSLVFGYNSPPFVRITITPTAFAHIEFAYSFVFGTSKQDAVRKLWQKDLTIDEMPCQILKRIPESYFYCDQI
jgi:6-phosphogluconolactonase/glucosamine-6-phosphate isomerase/deaminase